MAEPFDRFLADALAPEAREPDRKFVAQVQARIALEERLAAARRSILYALGTGIAGVLAVAAGLLWLAQSVAVTRFFAESPGVSVSALLAGFALLLVLFSSGQSQSNGFKVHFQVKSAS